MVGIGVVSLVKTFSKIFSSESTRPMETKLGLNHH
jgi:hypothetical protein